jgi:ferredoxin
MNNTYLASLEKYSESDWLSAVETLAPDIHEVDRVATQIWFRFYPLDLVRYLESADDVEKAMKDIAMDGDFGLLDKIDTSHYFLYGHRYWPQTRSEVILRAGNSTSVSDLADEIRSIAKSVSSDSRVSEEFTLGIAAVGLMTLVQTGLEELKAAPGIVQKPSGEMTRSPDEIVAERGKDDSQGLLGFLRTVDKEFSVRFAALTSQGRFKVINEEEIASASQKDHSRDWQSLDSRCWDGPVPIECTSASCGTCWVGVIGGAEKLSEPSERERKQMKVFGYGQPEVEKPFLRLACQAKATGNVSIVIPHWNAVFGKKVRGNVNEVELEPATTSAKKLRETIASAVSGE